MSLRNKLTKIGLASIVALTMGSFSYNAALAQEQDFSELVPQCKVIEYDAEIGSLEEKLGIYEDESCNENIFGDDDIFQREIVYQSDIFTDELDPVFCDFVQSWEFHMYSWLNKYVPEDKSLDPNLLATVMQIESNGYRDVVSTSGAIGLFQVMPYHFQQDVNPFNPNTNAEAAIRILINRLEDSEGDVIAALAGYNGGVRATEWFMGERTREEYVEIIDSVYGRGVGERKAQEVERYVERGMELYKNTLNRRYAENDFFTFDIQSRLTIE